jgi:mono/diheme cytochrome c family protein
MVPTGFLQQPRSLGGIGTFFRQSIFPAGLAMLILASVTPAMASHEDTPAWRLVKERCALCHYLDRAEAKFGPSLKGLFLKQRLSNGKPVNDQTVKDWIVEGSANMPAFKDTLTPQQIQMIIEYIKNHPPLDSWR